VSDDARQLDVSKFHLRGLREWSADGGDPDVALLGQRAAQALLQEDRALRARMRGSSAAADYQDDAAGLTYWLYETTLVYLVFRAWCLDHHVVWDWLGPGASSPGGRGKRQLDLVVELDDRRVGFEAKWWNTKAAGLSMCHDAAKLRNWRCRRPNDNGYLMAFWWTDSARLEDDQNAADEWFTAQGLRLEYRASFPTAGPQGKARRFFLDLIEVPT